MPAKAESESMDRSVAVDACGPSFETRCCAPLLRMRSLTKGRQILRPHPEEPCHSLLRDALRTPQDEGGWASRREGQTETPCACLPGRHLLSPTYVTAPDEGAARNFAVVAELVDAQR